MLEIALHTGTEHPNLVWILIPSILTFVTGVGIGHYSGTISNWLQSGTSTSE